MPHYKAIIDDGCNPELVNGAEFALPLGIPIIKTPGQIVIPKEITPFSQRERVVGSDDAIGFHENDILFAEVLRDPKAFIQDFSRFRMLISPDCSLYRDAPLAVQLTNLYRNRAIGSYYQRQGIYVVPQIRWGNEYTYTTKYFPEKIAFLGVQKHSIVAIGTYGCIQGNDNSYHLSADVEAMMETLEPAVVLVYGSMPDSIFGPYKQSAQFKHYDNWVTRQHENASIQNGKRKTSTMKNLLDLPLFTIGSQPSD